MSSPDKDRLAIQVAERCQLKKDLRSLLEQTIDQRVDRYFEINHQKITANHYFAFASSQAIELYRDGFFLSAVMVSQAINEGIVKFITCKNKENKENKNHSELLEILKQKEIISAKCAKASEQIRGSFRNDVHHMNPKVASIPLPKLAKRNLQDLATIEKEIFGFSVKNGKLVPHHPKYWDVKNDGTVPVFLRLL